MLRFTSVLACFLVAFSAQSQSTATLLDSVVKLYTQQKQFNGSVLVAQRGRVLLEKGYGYKDASAKTAPDGASLYQYGSVTKQFTSALVMHLQEKGKLNIQDKLSKYFPGLPFADSVTLYHLLTHSSGIYNYTQDRTFMQNETTRPISQERMLALFRNHPLEFTPGSKFSYSNSGYVLLGYIIEKASGIPYEKLMRQVVFQPLGMTTAGFDFAHNSSSDRTVGYNSIGDDNFDRAAIVDSSVSYAAGALYGSVRDLYAWHQALEGGKLLSAASWKQVYTPLHSHYAFGWEVDSLYGKPVVHHNGGIFGYTSTIKRFPQDDVVVIVLSNNGSPKVEEIADDLAGAVFGQPVKGPKETAAAQLPEDKLKEYVGEYEGTPGPVIVFRIENGVLKAKPTDEPEVTLVPEGESTFVIQPENIRVEFQRDGSGAVAGFSFSQGGNAMKAKKIK